MTTQSVRQITEHDVEAVRSLRLRALLDAPYAFSARYEDVAARSIAEWKSRVATWCRAETETCFLGFSDLDAVGMCGVECTTLPRANLVALWVDPDHRGKHLAGELVEAVCQFARQALATEVSAWVFESNERALRFYANRGFALFPDRRAYLPDPTKRELLTLKVL